MPDDTPSISNRQLAPLPAEERGVLIPRHRSAPPQRVAHEGPYRQLMEAAPDAVFVVALDGDDAGYIIDANTLAATMHGYLREELLVMRISDLDLPADAAAVPERIRNLLQNGEARFEVHHRRKDGSTFPVEVSARVTSMHGRRCAVAFNRDVSERERTHSQIATERTRLELAAKAGDIGFWDWDLITNDVYFSPEWKAHIGHAPGEIAHRYDEWQSRVHPDDLPAALASVRAHLDGKSSQHEADFRMRHKDGTWRWIHTRGQIVRDAEGLPLRMLGCHVDVSARKAAEASRIETKNLLRSFYDSPGVLRGVVQLLDDDIVHVTANVVTGELFEADRTTLVGKRLSDLGMPRESIGFLLRQYRQCLSEGRPISFDYTHATPSGPRRLFCTVAPSAADGSSARCVYSAFDRSALGRAEAATAAATERMHAIFEANPECIKTVSLDGRLLDMNRSGLQMVGASDVEQVRNLAVIDWVHPDDRAAFLQLHQQVVAGGSGQLEFRLVAGAGVQRCMDTHMVPLRDACGVVTSVLSVTREMTAVREVERQHAAMTNRVQQLQRLEAIGRLSGGIAHDFNNLLAAISGNVQLALMLPAPTDQHECLVEIRKATERAAALVRQILTFGRRQDADRCPVALGPVIADAVCFLRATMNSAIRFDVQIPEGLPRVQADPNQVHQILVNLGTNGCHAMETSGGCLSVRAAARTFEAHAMDCPADLSPGDFVAIEVVDTGGGMDATTLQHIFEPFFTTKKAGKGTGLGLSVVHGIVRDHGGSIVVHSQPGCGSTFCVYLPVSTVGAEPVLPTPQVLAGGGEHVLVVDDEPSVLLAMGKLVHRLGYRVTTCADAEQALAMLVAAPASFDLVLTDNEMTGMNGPVFAQQAIQVNPELPIVLYSGYLQPDVVQRAEAACVRRILHKPVEPNELATCLAEVLAAK